MKRHINKMLTLSFLLGLLLFVPSGCSLDDEVDPNNPSLNGVLSNASISELNNIVIGSESGMRDAIEYYLDDVGVVGREMYRFAGSEPRYTQDLLGQENATLDNNAFYTTRQWHATYRAVKNCNILLASVDNTGAPTDAQKQGYRGYANTIKAYELLIALNLTGSNGVRIEVADPNNLGPIVPYNDALTAIAGLLEQGNTQLTNAEFAFTTTLAPSVADFQKFNRALAARVAAYRGLYTDVLTYLNASFLILMGAFKLACFMFFLPHPEIS